MTGLGPEVLAAGQAIGLLDDGGLPVASWFEQPLAALRKMLANPGQKNALLGLLDQVLPPAPPSAVGGAASEKWHPLLGDRPAGNLYLTVANGAAPLTLGVAGELHSTTSPIPAALRCHLPIARIDGDAAAMVAGTADGPFELDLRLELGWSRTAGQSIDLRAIRLTASLAPLAEAPFSVAVVLEGFSADARAAADTRLDLAQLEGAALQVIVGLIREQLAQATGLSGEAATVAQHLLPVLGLAAGFPPFPFDDPSSVRGWLAALASAGHLADWVGHLGALLGGSSALAGSGTASDPWRVVVLPIDAASSLELTAAIVTAPQTNTPSLELGLQARYLPSSQSPAVRIDAQAVFVSVPLQGSSPASVIPRASIAMAAPGDAAASLVTSSDLTVQSLRAGAQWDGARIAPLLELDGVTFKFENVTKQYDRIDLTHASAVVAAASDLVVTALQGFLGTTGTAAHLLALIGLTKPAGDPGWTHAVNRSTLVSNPTRAIAAVHRAALLDATHSWAFLFAEIVGLLGLGDPNAPIALAGTGTADDPWRIPLESDVITLELAAWNAGNAANAAEPQKLRLGLRLSAASDPWQASWLAELLAFDLPASGAGQVALLGAQHGRLELSPVPSLPETAGITIAADALALTLDWSPGAKLQIQGKITQLAVTGVTTISVPSLVLPPPGGFDLSNPQPTLGIGADDLRALFRALLARGALSWGGVEGLTLGAIFGLHAKLPGLQPDWPVLTGDFFTDPFGALRAWVSKLILSQSADGTPFLPNALAWLQAFLRHTRRALDAPAPDAVEGSGAYDDPWAVQVAPGVEVLTWLEPEGPPSVWAKALADLIATHDFHDDLVQWGLTLGTLVPTAREALGHQDVARAIGGLTALEGWLRATDGFVDAEAQVPTGATWTAGSPIAAAHLRQPADPSAIAQITAQIGAWNPSDKAVLLLGPAFSDHRIWSDLLASVAVKPNFDLRVVGLDPQTIELTGVTDAAEFYTCDLAAAELAGTMAQLGRVVARIAELRPSVPVTLVAHSTAGLAARAFAAANPSAVRGLITLGTPHLAGSPLPLLDADAATAVRAIAELTPALAAGPLRDALDGIVAALDGRLAGFKAADFETPADATVDTAGVPALAIAGAVGQSLFAQLKQALHDLASASAATPRAAPTHLAFGVRAQLDFGVDGEVQTDVALRCDAGRIALQPGAPEPPRPARGFGLTISLARPGDWLAGSASAPTRVRWAELGVTTTALSASSLQPFVRLHGAALESTSLGVVDLARPQTPLLLGEVFRAISALAADAGPALTAVLSGLGALGLTAPDPHGGVALSLDAFRALTADPAGYLGPRMHAVLAQTPTLRGPFQLQAEGGAVGVRVDGLAFSDLARASIDARVSLATLQPSLDLTFTVGGATLRFAQSTGRLTLEAAPWIEPLTLVPPPAAPAIVAAFERAIPRVLFSAAASAAIEAALGEDLPIGPLAPLLEDPGAFLVSASALGNGQSLDAARITELLKTIADLRGVMAAPELALPGGLQLAATGSGSDPVEIALSTATPIGGVLDLALAARIDGTRHVTPAGTATLTVPLPGSWPSLTIAFGVDPSGVSLAVTPQIDPPLPPIAPIQLLPTFSGLGPLLGSAGALLPAALDKLVDTVGPSAVRDDALDLAQAFGLYDPAGKFSAHGDAWRALTAGDWAATVSTGVQTAAAAALAKVLGHAAGNVTVSGNTAVIQVGADFRAALGWDGGPTLSLATTALKAGQGALTSDIALGFAAGKPLADVTLALHLQSSLGIDVTPALEVSYEGGVFGVRLLPLGTANETTLSVTLAPEVAVHHAPDFAAALARAWVLPITSELLVRAVKPRFAAPVWTGGPTLQDLLAHAGIVTAAGDLVTPLPEAAVLVRQLLAAVAAEAEVDVGGVKLKLVSDATGLGLSVRGAVDIPLGGVQLQVRFEHPSLATAHQGVTIYLFDPAGAFAPRLSIAGLGAFFEGPGGGPLVNTSGFRMQAAGGTLFFEVDEGGVENLGATLDVKGLGLPLGLLGGDHDGGNPVAGSLVQGAQAPSDDAQPVNPAVDVTVSYLDGSFGIQLGGPAPPVWIGVHRSFGPIYIDQLGLGWNTEAADLLIDATVKVAALTVQTYELGLHVPFRQLLDPTKWSLDLQGLAVGFAAGPVTIAGGLIKNPGPPVEYDGVLSADIAGYGVTVVGSYARPSDVLGRYTSLFIFASLPVTLGGPPYLFVTGLGGGAAYNRQLHPPTDVNQIPSFFLVSAMDDASLANDPMGALKSMGAFAPPRRGAYWLAAGVRFSSFVVVNTVAVAYVALDRGFEVGLLGVSRLQQPLGEPLVNIEMALKARFSSAEGTLLIQAQLTDHSWLFSHDCQLTGGFAFFVWFPEGHFALTIGGYHPAFKKPPEFPDVPRLGFRWQVAKNVQIKGEAYFAITSSAFMCGGRLEATASFDGISAWFTVHLDILIQWDPFHYDFRGGIEVGVSLTIEVCFFGCVSVDISISKGCEIHVFGPPFRAELTFDAYVTSITLAFGGDAHPVPDALPWITFRDKYLIAGNPANTWVGARPGQGMIPSEPPGAQPIPGTAAEPWRLTPEFAVVTESRMPVSGYAVTTATVDPQGPSSSFSLAQKTDAKAFDLAPMQKVKVGSLHSVVFSPAFTHPELFKVEELSDLLPEATWRWYDPAHLPAAANRIRAISGLRITGTARLRGQSALVPIATLKDDDPRFALPLPFAAVPVLTGALQTAGLAADALAVLASTAGSGRSLAAAATVLSGGGFFAQARADAGLPAPGLPPVAARALRRDRSAPPLLTPLSTGLTMKDVGLAKPPTFAAATESPAVRLTEARLKAVLQARPFQAVDAPAALRTTVTGTSLAAARVPRMAPPKPGVVPGAKLQTMAATKVLPPTSQAAAGRSTRSAEIGALTGAIQTAAFTSAARSLRDKGVTLAAGVTHVWQLTGAAHTFELRGSAAVRVVYLDRAGQILQDTEQVVAGNLASASPTGSETAVFMCLGEVPAGLAPPAGFGAVTSAIAPPGGIAASGWQVGNVFQQIAPSTILARGATIALHRPFVGVSKQQKTTLAMTEISSVVSGQPGLETRLPGDTRVVMILLDRQDATAASAGDLTVACPDATLGVPIIGAGGARTALLYDVVSRKAESSRLSISVVSKAGWSLAGVVGLHGRAVEWAAELHGSPAPKLVAGGGPLSPSGSLTVREISGGHR